MFRKMKVLLCLLLLLSMVPIQRAEAAQVETEGYIQQLISYYRHYQQDAAGDIQRVLDEMCAENLEEGARWTEIMNSWRWINEQMPVQSDVLPDGLAEDNRLCIVVMGFALETNGSMKPELISRLEVALESARKYPNAILVCTGGATSQRADITEAGQMGDWLQKQGIPKSRIIRETASLSTTANAVNCYKLLNRAYPQVDSIAVVTSDYHIRQSCAMFAAVSNYQAGYKGGKTLELVGNAVCDTGLEENSLLTQAWGMSLVFGIPFDEKAEAPELYPVEIPVEVYTEPTETEETVPEAPVPLQPSRKEENAETERRWASIEKWVILIAGAVTAVIFFIFMPKKPQKRNRREKPKMNWDV